MVNFLTLNLEQTMSKKNEFGLFDGPQQFSHEERTVELSKQDIQEQLAEGAFLLHPDDAVGQGLLDPYLREENTEMVNAAVPIVVTREEAAQMGLM
jgi:hypothetical protein